MTSRQSRMTRYDTAMLPIDRQLGLFTGERR